MVRFNKKIAIAASLLALYCGQFYANASSKLSGDPDLSVGVVSSVVGQFDANILRKVPTDVWKLIFTKEVCEDTCPVDVALSCKTFYRIMFGREFAANGQDKSLAPFMRYCLESWWAKRDREILLNGLFRNDPQNRRKPGDVMLSGMYLQGANGELVLPGHVEEFLCVTKNVATFVRPKGHDKEKSIELVLTLVDLKKVARDISADESFLDYVNKAALSENSVCVLIRHGSDDISAGFRCLITKFINLSGAPIWQIYGSNGGWGDCVPWLFNFWSSRFDCFNSYFVFWARIPTSAYFLSDTAGR